MRGPFSQILTTKSTKKNKKAQKQFKKFLKRESEGGTTFKMFLPHGRGDMTGSQFRSFCIQVKGVNCQNFNYFKNLPFCLVQHSSWEV
ncbi:MAG: hypothetical protein IJD43_03420, partial [Thermoguttaceae bacterium]|nr:hypothetical protein [Thermoguttaceae bacterium]